MDYLCLILILVYGRGIKQTPIQPADKPETEIELVSVYDQLKSDNLKTEKNVLKAVENGKFGAIDETGTDRDTTRI